MVCALLKTRSNCICVSLWISLHFVIFTVVCVPMVNASLLAVCMRFVWLLSYVLDDIGRPSSHCWLYIFVWLLSCVLNDIGRLSSHCCLYAFVWLMRYVLNDIGRLSSHCVLYAFVWLMSCVLNDIGHFSSHCCLYVFIWLMSNPGLNSIIVGKKYTQKNPTS